MLPTTLRVQCILRYEVCTWAMSEASSWRQKNWHLVKGPLVLVSGLFTIHSHGSFFSRLYLSSRLSAIHLQNLFYTPLHVCIGNLRHFRHYLRVLAKFDIPNFDIFQSFSTNYGSISITILVHNLRLQDIAPIRYDWLCFSKAYMGSCSTQTLKRNFSPLFFIKYLVLYKTLRKEKLLSINWSKKIQ